MRAHCIIGHFLNCTGPKLVRLIVLNHSPARSCSHVTGDLVMVTEGCRFAAAGPNNVRQARAAAKQLNSMPATSGGRARRARRALVRVTRAATEWLNYLAAKQPRAQRA